MTRAQASPRLQCLITFDYELYHGRNYGSADEVLFEPTARLLDLCDSLSVATTFFPDICSVWWHREHNDDHFATRFEEQMQEALRRGHDVQLHLHPHWLSCKRENGHFVFEASKIYLNDLGWGGRDTEAPAVIRRGVDYLNRLLGPVTPSYRCVAFRAASLALQPREQDLLLALQSAGIRLDTSVTRGVRTVSDTYTLDYRDVPAVANWLMNPATGLSAADEGILEVPIGTFRASLRQRVRFLWRRARAVGARRGEPMSRTGRQNRVASAWHLLRTNLRYLGGDPWFTLSCDTKGFDTDMLARGLEAIVDQHQHEPRIAVAIINHPKLMAAPQLAVLRGFVERTRDRFGADVEFTTTTTALHTMLAPTGERLLATS